MHTSHLVNARTKTDRVRCGEKKGWNRVETVLVREFTSIFISTCRQLFTPTAGTELRAIRRIRRRDTRGD